MTCNPKSLHATCEVYAKPDLTYALSNMTIGELANLHEALRVLSNVTAGLVSQPRFSGRAPGHYLDDLCDELDIKSDAVMEHLEMRHPATDECRNIKALKLIECAAACKDTLPEIETLVRASRALA